MHIHPKDGFGHTELRQFRLHVGSQPLSQHRAQGRQALRIGGQHRFYACDVRCQFFSSFLVMCQPIQLGARLLSVSDDRINALAVFSLQRSQHAQPFFYFLQPFRIELHSVAITAQFVAGIGNLFGGGLELFH